MLDQILHAVTSIQGQTTIAAIIVEAGLHMIKSDKPLGIAHAIAAGAHKVADIVAGIANFLDKILPQNLK